MSNEQPSQVSPELIEHYNRSSFHVKLMGELIAIQPGVENEALVRGLRACKADSAAFITAHNPYSVRHTFQQNAERNELLRNSLHHLNLPISFGAGVDEAGEWPEEVGYLVMGIDLATAEEIGRAAQQNAILWAEKDGVSQIILLR